METNLKIELMKFYDAEHGSWYLENEKDFYFESSLPEGDLRGLFYMDDGVVRFGGFEFTDDKFFVSLTNQVSKDVCDDLQSKWLPLATETLQAMIRRDGI